MTLKSLRKEIHFTQEDLANYMSISVSTIRSWEQGSKIPEGYKTLLCKCLYYEGYFSQVPVIEDQPERG